MDTQHACSPCPQRPDMCGRWRRLQVVQAQHSADGGTSKLLLELQDGLTVEAVIMHYDTSGALPKS